MGQKKPFAGLACEGLGRLSLICTPPDVKGGGTPFTCRRSVVRGRNGTYYAPLAAVVVVWEKFNVFSPLSWLAFSNTLGHFGPHTLVANVSIRCAAIRQ